ncbi:MAG: prolipoprotein diacylglyceryl transferase [Bdellovibrionales bacterium RIFOXYD12_FULL_39_22]|nr:MAG: prolipoprotein diacylglyceryl transferase [Bdellovibrionales bacterium RIFOXYB1_FULL_39_21]OFZ41737.1 MAG: prolipoprotein diacylglyceryl transferase [Bdellovibrionales bacterium RIFOXYC12_FULL_39_17]OFZ46137.1 MAG: prolipoprotein diacylglyceryl transferase [Bdellovibrionales bacterium RIFOXYC1_FULL_39_130]OFZ69088.1 MAG: prolipoprotein diacylglyceryl transferase [Bdellovibrionales bacterium RIFOXYC2_FULL_39_8]OFZ74963.1 MAG: prolipoprotein diacylglyceryl transferase [Bdellovibrionales b
MEVNFDPTIFKLGVLQVRWYGMMYLIGYVIATFLCHRLVKEGLFKIPREKIDSLVTHMFLGMFLGARITYVLVYGQQQLFDDPLRIFYVWEGGLSFHGAIIGYAIAGLIFARKNKIHLFHVWDCVVTVGAQGLFFGRIGNFLNMELFGRVTDVPWGMIFPGGGPYPRHPSQLYEAFFEGIVLFSILWISRKNISRCGVQYALFLIIYGVFRYFIEFFREADVQMGYYLGGTTTMGQILCIIMSLCGVFALWYSLKTQPKIIQA